MKALASPSNEQNIPMKSLAVPTKEPLEHNNDVESIHSIHNQEEPDQNFKIYSTSELKSIKRRGYLTLLGGVCLHLVLGTFYLWGGISKIIKKQQSKKKGPYIAAYLKAYDESVTLSTLSVVFPIMGIIMNSVLSFGVKLAGRIGYKTMIFGGGFVISLAFLILSFITNLIAFIMIYSVMIGISSGLVYMLPILCGWKFFPFHRGRVSGLVVAGYGFGSFIFNFVCQGYVNPNNEHPSVVYMEDGKVQKYFREDIYDKVPNMFRILAGSYFALTIIATLLTEYPKGLDLEYQQVLGQGKKPSGIDHSKSVDYHPTVLHQECESLRRGLHSRPFYFMMPMIIFSIMFGMLMANSYKIYGLRIGLSDQMLTIVGSIASASNGCSRLIWASLMDRFGFRKIYLIIMVLNLICTSIIGYVNSAGNGIGYLFILSVTMGCEGGIFSMFPAQASNMFGHKVGPIIYGVLFFGIGVSNIIAYLFLKFAEPLIGFQGLFWICFGSIVIAFVLGVLYKEKYDWKKK